MTWFRCGGGGSGISAALKNRMNAVLNKKFGTAVDYPPNGWPDDVNLLGELEEKTTAAASICAFDDGADDVPTKSLVVTIPPTLSGVSSVTETQTGKTVFYPMDIEQGSISESGYNSNSIYRIRTAERKAVTPSTEYKIKVNSEVQIYEVHEYTDLTGSSTHLTVNASEYTFTTKSTTNYLKILFRYSNNATITPSAITELQVTDGDFYWKTYSASLGRTIYGGTADIVNGTGTETYARIKISDLTWSIQTVSGRSAFVSGKVTGLPTTSPKNVLCDVLTYDGEKTIGAMTDKTLITWTNTFRVYDTDCEDVTEFLNTYGNGFIVYQLAESARTDFIFTGQEVPTRLGYNAFWSDEGDTEVTYRGQGTITPVLPTLISKSITENGTYSAEDDGVDGYDEVTVDVSGGGTIIVDDLIEYPYPNNDNKCIYSSELSTQYAYYAFNPDCGNPYYWSSVGATNQYIGWKFDTAQIVNYYEIWTRNVGNVYDYLQAPKEWKLQGSNDDGVTWVDLDTQDFTFSAGGQKWAGAVNNTTAYKWYRIFVITAQDTSNDTVIGYIDFKHAYISA